MLPLILLWAETVSDILDPLTKEAFIDVFYLDFPPMNLADVLLILGGTRVLLIISFQASLP